MGSSLLGAMCLSGVLGDFLEDRSIPGKSPLGVPRL